MNKTPLSFYTIRFGDCDLFSHLNNARYIDYFLNAREDHLKEFYQLELSSYYQQGIGWLVGSHEISYLRPAAYNEEVCIKTGLLEVTPELLLVEMSMMDEQQTHLKSYLWTKFIPVDIKTGRKDNHSEEFMQFAKSIETKEAGISKGYQHRLKEVVYNFKNLSGIVLNK